MSKSETVSVFVPLRIVKMSAMAAVTIRKQINNTGLSKFVPRDMLGEIKDKELTRYFEQQLRERLMSEEEMKSIARAIGLGFEERNRTLLDTSREVMLELINEIPFDRDYQTNVLMQYADKLNNMQEQEYINEGFKILDEVEMARKILDSPLISTYTLSELADVIRRAGIRKLTPAQEAFVKCRMDFYRQPLSNKELKQLTNILSDKILNYNIRQSELLKDKTVSFVWDSVMNNVKKYPELKRAFIAELKDEFIQPNKSWLRCFLDDSVNKNVLNLNTQTLIVYMFQNNIEFLKKVMAYDLNGVANYIKYHDQGLYNILADLHNSLLLTREFDKYKK